MNEVLKTVDGNIYVPRTWLDLIYPIGRGFIDFTDTDYSNYLGFTWERELVGLTPVGCDATGSNIGTTMGSETHKHESPIGFSRYSDGYYLGISVNEFDMNRSDHNSTAYSSCKIDKQNQSTTSGSFDTYSTKDTSSYQPSKVVAYWKRVA